MTALADYKFAAAGSPRKLKPSFYLPNDDNHHHHDNTANDKASMAFDHIVIDFFRSNPS
jgi:hypothetical protein